jgi:hypothetical protein
VLISGLLNEVIEIKDKHCCDHVKDCKRKSYSEKVFESITARPINH